MKRLVHIAGIAIALVLIAVGGATAHHSFTATYDTEKSVDMEGVVQELLWRNPHSFLRIDVKGSDGAVKRWSLEWGSISQLSKSEVTRTTLKIGDVVKVSGQPARDPSSMRILLQAIERPVDGFVWRGRVE